MSGIELDCPYCWEPIEVPADPGGGELVEDCPVCCQPIRLRILLDEHGAIEHVDYDREND